MKEEAEIYYRAAFHRFVDDLWMNGKAPLVFQKFERRMVIAPSSVFTPLSRSFNDQTQLLNMHGFCYLDEDRLAIRLPNSSLPEPRTLTAVEEELSPLVGARWIWPVEQLPTLEDLCPYALLPNDFVPNPAISDLKTRDRVLRTDQAVWDDDLLMEIEKLLYRKGGMLKKAVEYVRYHHPD